MLDNKPEVSIMDNNGNEIILITDKNDRQNTVTSYNRYTVAGVDIRIKDGLYNLSDIHKASREGDDKRPGIWLSEKDTATYFKAVMKLHENTKITDHCIKIKSDIYVSELPLLRYAFWASPIMELIIMGAYRDKYMKLSSNTTMMRDNNKTKINEGPEPTFTGSTDNNTISDYAMYLNHSTGLGFTPSNTFTILRKLNYLKSGRVREEKNQPHQKFIDEGLFNGGYYKLGTGRNYYTSTITDKGMNDITDEVITMFTDLYGGKNS